MMRIKTKLITLLVAFVFSFSVFAQEETCQSIDFPAGWSIFSTYIETDNMDAYYYFAQMFNPGSQIILINESGAACLYEYAFCAIPYIEIEKGYRVKLSEAQTREFCGTLHLPELSPITLNEGWGLLPYLRTTPQNTVAALSDIADEIILVKDYLGNVYLPSMDYNGIGDLQPGQGYQIKMSSEQTLIYDANEN